MIQKKSNQAQKNLDEIVLHAMHCGGGGGFYPPGLTNSIYANLWNKNHELHGRGLTYLVRLVE